ncbi:bifunctional adenosylcobinamide kinase/adenosylcobinamide-phosphate guanylyltransferase [Arenibacterium sp. CAU 1754]
MLPATTLVLGGAASGKSAYAELLVTRRPSPWVYLATAQAFDDEMRHKIDDHIARRAAGWKTEETPLDAAAHLADLPAGATCLFDCATMWLSNHLLADSDLEHEQIMLLAAIEKSPAHIIIVSNEVGHGIVPDNALARRFREAQGRLNILLAAQADVVVQVTAGLPRTLKGDAP